MNFKGILYYLSLFFFPVSFLSFINILYSAYFDYFLSLDSYIITFFSSLFIGTGIYFYSKNHSKKINFYEQLILIFLVFLIIPLIISIPFYLSNYQLTLINSYFESVSGFTGTGFSIFENIKYLDPTLIIWRSSSQWLGGFYFLIFLLLVFSSFKSDYKLTHLVPNTNKNSNLLVKNDKSIVKIFFLYLSLTAIIFLLFSMTGIRLFNGLNLTMSVVSAGAFLPTNSLSQIISTPPQKIILLISFIISTLNIYFFYSLFFNNKRLNNHYEDFTILILSSIFSIILLLTIKDTNILDSLINVLSSIGNSGLSLTTPPKYFTFYFLLLTILGGSILSNTSGIKFLRIYILLKATYIEILRLVKPNNIVNHNILFTKNKINSENIKLSFLVFILFFFNLLIFSSFLLFDNLNFENSFKLAILAITNTYNGTLYGLDEVDFSNLLTTTKICFIIFMILGKIELISFLLVIKKLFFKN